MKALILVGGFGTRLRPLTFSCPKPLVDFANLPIVAHQIEALAKVGVTEIILAIGFQPAQMIEPIKKFEKDYNVKITCSYELEPLGTAGPIRLAKDLLIKDNPEQLFFVFNSDVICDFPLKDLIKIHKEKQAEGTIYLTKVTDPSKYGVVLSDNNQRIKQFIEKPKQFISDRINAGLYIFNTKIIERIPMQPAMLEKDIFPKMADDGVLFAIDLPGIWMDVGQPKDFLIGTQLYLSSLRQRDKEKLLKEEGNIIGNVLVHPTAVIHKSAVIGPNVTIGEKCIVEEGVRLKDTVMLQESIVRAHSWVDNSIIGWKSTVGKWVRIEGTTVLGEDVHIKDEIYINACCVLPHKTVNTSITEKNQIIM